MCGRCGWLVPIVLTVLTGLPGDGLQLRREATRERGRSSRVTSSFRVRAHALDDGFAYFTSEVNGRLERAPKSGGTPEEARRRRRAARGRSRAMDADCFGPRACSIFRRGFVAPLPVSPALRRDRS